MSKAVDESNRNPNEEHLAEIWTRVVAKVIKLAALITVSVNPRETQIRVADKGWLAPFANRLSAFWRCSIEILPLSHTPSCEPIRAEPADGLSAFTRVRLDPRYQIELSDHSRREFQRGLRYFRAGDPLMKRRIGPNLRPPLKKPSSCYSTFRTRFINLFIVVT
jgi:hypothetical protein